MQHAVDSLQQLAHPTRRSPFIFYHPRKCGGSSFRRHLAASAAAAGVPDAEVLLPGLNGMHPFIYTTDLYFSRKHMRNVAVLGMHTEWGVHRRVGALQPLVSDDVACATMIRHPVDRVVSCFYHRCVHCIRHQPVGRCFGCADDYKM